MPSTLSVWFFSDHVGTLLYENGNLSFRYDRAWLENPAATPLSCSLPLEPGTFGDPVCRSYFAGLLPEGEMRRLIAHQHCGNRIRQHAADNTCTDHFADISCRQLFHPLVQQTG